MAFDPECKKLVEYFLSDEPELKADLSFIDSVSQEIQDCIEGSIDLYKAEKRAERRHRENQKSGLE